MTGAGAPARGSPDETASIAVLVDIVRARTDDQSLDGHAKSDAHDTVTRNAPAPWAAARPSAARMRAKGV
jgi:hypothetical protein